MSPLSEFFRIKGVICIELDMHIVKAHTHTHTPKHIHTHTHTHTEREREINEQFTFVSASSIILPSHANARMNVLMCGSVYTCARARVCMCTILAMWNKALCVCVCACVRNIHTYMYVRISQYIHIRWLNRGGDF